MPASVRILPLPLLLFRGQAVRFNQPSGKHMVFPLPGQERYSFRCHDIVSVHVDNDFHILLVRILVMGTLVKPGLSINPRCTVFHGR